MKKLSCAEARQIDLVEYLASLGHQPKKIRNQDYWYCSPFREEKTPSFKVNKKRNIWFDFGEGKGGDIIDFGVHFFKCSVNKALEQLSQNSLHQNFSFHPLSVAGEKKEPGGGKILILNERPLAAQPLLQYLQKRCIPVEIAEFFCKEIDFLLYGKKYTAIGFQNNAGGYELRSENFKGSSSPKDITFVDHRQQKVAVFEGFFNYLSFQTITLNKSKELTNLPDPQAIFLILNSLSFFEKSREKMEDHRQIHLFLDRDKAGLKYTQQALQWSGKYIDQSTRYKLFKDINEYLIKHQEPQQKQSLRPGRHL